MRRILFRTMLHLLTVAGVLLSSPLHADNTTPGQFGVYLGAGCDGTKRLPAYTAWLGRTPDRALEFLDNSSWENMLNAAKWASGCWLKTGLSMTYSVPMLVRTGGTLAEGASGAYDSNFRRLAAILIAAGHSDAIIRIGWEFNGNWYQWAASKDPGSWVAYWRRIVLAMRSAPGARFKFDWCPAIGTLAIAPEKVYPGDDVVDIIGLDVYNQSWIVNWSDPEARWKDFLDGKNGLTWHRNFALAHAKSIAYGEWGTGTRPDGHGGGDDPLFVERMAAFIALPGVLYHDYWEYTAADYDSKLSTGKFPLAAEAFLKAYRPK